MSSAKFDWNKLFVHRAYWPKVIMFAFAIFLPTLAIGYSNYHVFTSAFPIATVLLIVTCGIAGLSTYFSGIATPGTRRYSILLDVVIGCILCVNLLFHFQIAREISGAEQARVDVRADEDRQQEMLDRQARRDIALTEARAKAIEAQKAQLEAQRRVLVQLPVSQRRVIGTAEAPSVPATTPDSLGAALTTKTLVPAATGAIRTPEEVRQDWYAWLFWTAACEVFASVLGGLILVGIWQWDVNGDGIDDAVQMSTEELRAAILSPQFGAHTAARRPNVKTGVRPPKS